VVEAALETTVVVAVLEVAYRIRLKWMCLATLVSLLEQVVLQV
jgi:hypothetical protein